MVDAKRKGPKDPVARNLERERESASSLVAELRQGGHEDETLFADMVEGETGLYEAIEAAISEIDDCDVTIAGVDAKVAQLTERKRRAEARQERLRGLIEQAMLIADLRSIKLPTATLSVRDVAPKPMIHDESLIPAAFWGQPDPVLDRKKINEAVKSGDTVPGVSQTNGSTSLTIRRV